MKKSLIIAGALSLGLVLGGCSDDGGTDGGTSAQTSSADADSTEASAEGAGSPEEAACAAFFEQGSNTLADRADAARDALSNGEVTDMVTYGEVNLLEQRISGVAENAPEEIAATLTTIDEPFKAAVDAVNDGAADPETGEIKLPEIDVKASADAQAELESTCNA